MDAHTLSYGLNIVLGALSAGATIWAGISKRGKAVAVAIATAEKAVDRAAYRGGKLDTAREAIALAVLAKIFPRASQEELKSDLEAVLSEVHQHVDDIKASS